MRNRSIYMVFGLTILLLSGCKILGLPSDTEEQCDCCTENLLESEQIQDLIDGDNEWLGLVIGETNPSDVLSYFSGENISYCVSSKSEEICNGNVENILTQPQGIIYLSLLNLNCQPFGISWEDEKISSIGFYCEDCILIHDLITEIDAVPYISSFYSNLHETRIMTLFYYPEYGLRIGTEPLDRNQAYLVDSTPIVYIKLNLPQDKMETSSFGNFIFDYDVNCARLWKGYGDIYNLYYPEDTGLGCPYKID